jgi:hypothetical protein
VRPKNIRIRGEEDYNLTVGTILDQPAEHPFDYHNGGDKIPAGPYVKTRNNAADERTNKLQKKPSTLKREHPARGSFSFLLDPDLATQINADPCGSCSGFTTLRESTS